MKADRLSNRHLPQHHPTPATTTTHACRCHCFKGTMHCLKILCFGTSRPVLVLCRRKSLF
jgi:hypothetical protein